MHHCHFVLLQHNYTKKRTVTREHLMLSLCFFLHCSYANKMTTREHSCVVVIFLFVLLQHNYAKRRTTTWQHFHIIIIFFLLQCNYTKRTAMTHEHSHVIIIFLLQHIYTKRRTMMRKHSRVIIIFLHEKDDNVGVFSHNHCFVFAVT
jgi:hypothetical protein